MTYIIGWHDLPAARLLVPVMRILEYVSPPVLEEWEWNLELELEEERAKLKQEKTPGDSTKNARPTTGPKKKKKRRGRPPVHSQIEAAAVVNSETEAQATAPPAKGVMSLSTPQKARLDRFEGLSEDELSPSRQVEEELLASQARHQAQRDVAFPPTTVEPVARSLTPAMKAQTPIKCTPPSKPMNGAHTTQSHTPLPPLRPEPPPHHEFTFSFTPISSSLQNHFTSDTQHSISEEVYDDTPSEKPKKRRKKEKEHKPATEDGEPVWEVQRLEDMEWFEVEGKGLVRYFKVRWEGDWPPDQNPSWEPEENIPPTLVRNYLKNPKRNSKVTKPALKRKRDELPWASGRKYSSVSEAFAAEIDDDAMDLVRGEDHSEAAFYEQEREQQELFVVEERTDSAHGRASRDAGQAFGSAESGLFLAYMG
jgi:hypothetical protein